MESKLATPSVIARLMGLDELPPKQPVRRPHRVLSENYLRKSASIGLIEKRSCHESRSFKVSNEKGQELIQANQGVKANSSTTEVKMSFVRQKSTDAKHLPMDEKFRHSILFDDVLEELDSNLDFLLRNHQQPDSSFVDHIRDLQFDLPRHQSCHATVKSSNARYGRKSEIFRKSERTTARRNILRSLQKLESNSYTDSCGDLGTDYTRQLLKSRLELKDKTSIPPSRIVKNDTRHLPSTIVVLKPNIGKAQNAARPSCSPISQEGSPPSDRKHLKLSKPKNEELHNQLEERKKLADDVEPSILSSLKEVSRTNSKVNETSKNESEAVMPSSPSFSEWKKRCQTAYPPLSRSSFTRQDKKLLSERWKMTGSLHQVGVAGRGTTPGETLATPDNTTSPQNLNYKLDIRDLNNQLSLNNGDADLGSPLRFSSGDVLDITKSRTRNTGELKSGCGENNLSRNSEENSIYPNSPISSVFSLSLDSGVTAVAEIENVGLSSGDLEEQQSEEGACILFMKDENSSRLLDAFDEQESQIRSREEALISSSCPELGPEFSMVEGYSPSPISVLEPPFSEETLSDSECFQAAGADFHDLRMQLQLLKSESEETNSEGPGIVVSSDEDSGNESVDFSEESKKLPGSFSAEESRDFSYVVDVLDEAGFLGSNANLGFKWWYSPDSPVNPSVFEMVEKKYSNQMAWDTSERRLLFDCVNSGLKEILQPCMDVLTREKPVRKKFSLSLSREVIEEELWAFLDTRGKQVGKDLSEKALGTEIRWFELREDIDTIVCEVERFLVDELAAELVRIQSL